MERENDFDSNNIEGQFTPCVMPVYKVKCKPEKARIRQVCQRIPEKNFTRFVFSFFHFRSCGCCYRPRTL